MNSFIFYMDNEIYLNKKRVTGNFYTVIVLCSNPAAIHANSNIVF